MKKGIKKEQLTEAGQVVLDVPKQGQPKADEKFDKGAKWITERIKQLKEARKKCLNGKDIEDKWRELDKLYVPHECSSTALEDWQSKNSHPIPYSKIQSAISIITRQNVQIVPQPMSADYEAKNEFIKGLCAKIKEKGSQDGQLMLFELSRATKGFAVGRCYHRKITRLVEEVFNVDPVTKEEYKQQKYRVDFDDPYFENISIYDCWIDDAAKPFDMYSAADWCWRVPYRLADFQKEFPTETFPRAAFVEGKANVTKHSDEGGHNSEIIEGNDIVEVVFYENWKRDKMAIYANDLCIDIFPLPYQHKMLSLVHALWTLRPDGMIQGIGLLEALQQDHEMLDKVRNMSLDQLLLSIWAPFLYSGGEELDNITKSLRPGKGIKVNDPKNINWMTIPSGNTDAVRREEMLKDDIDDATGITKTLSGEIIGKTVYEAEQNRQAGMRKMSNPIRALENAVEWAWNLLIPLAQQVYAQPVVSQRIVGKGGLTAYEIMLKDNPDQVQVNADGTVAIINPRMMRMPVEINDEGVASPSEQDKDIIMTGDLLKWEGRIKIKAFSMMPDDPFTQRENFKELYQMLYGSPNADTYKLDKELCKQYDRSPNDLLKTELELAQTQQMADMARSMGVAQETLGAPPTALEGSMPNTAQTQGGVVQGMPQEQMPMQGQVQQEQQPMMQ